MANTHQSAPFTSQPPQPVSFIRPGEFYCPISQVLMTDPVIDAEGYTYERKAIEQLFEQTGFPEVRRSYVPSPITQNPIYKNDLMPNWALKSYMEHFEALLQQAQTLPTALGITTPTTPTTAGETKETVWPPVGVDEIMPYSEVNRSQFMRIFGMDNKTIPMVTLGSDLIPDALSIFVRALNAEKLPQDSSFTPHHYRRFDFVTSGHSISAGVSYVAASACGVGWQCAVCQNLVTRSNTGCWSNEPYTHAKICFKCIRPAPKGGGVPLHDALAIKLQTFSGTGITISQDRTPDGYDSRLYPDSIPVNFFENIFDQQGNVFNQNRFLEVFEMRKHGFPVLDKIKVLIKKNGLTACNGCFDKSTFEMTRAFDFANPSAPNFVDLNKSMVPRGLSRAWSCYCCARKGVRGASRWRHEYWVSMAQMRSHDICYDCISPITDVCPPVPFWPEIQIKYVDEQVFMNPDTLAKIRDINGNTYTEDIFYRDFRRLNLRVDKIKVVQTRAFPQQPSSTFRPEEIFEDRTFSRSKLTYPNNNVWVCDVCSKIGRVIAPETMPSLVTERWQDDVTGSALRLQLSILPEISYDICFECISSGHENGPIPLHGGIYRNYDDRNTYNIGTLEIKHDRLLPHTAESEAKARKAPSYSLVSYRGARAVYQKDIDSDSDDEDIIHTYYTSPQARGL